jgi:ABC-type nitrate/sulfonate/bicarbonate transport system substrate-binding protein
MRQRLAFLGLLLLLGLGLGGCGSAPPARSLVLPLGVGAYDLAAAPALLPLAAAGTTFVPERLSEATLTRRLTGGRLAFGLLPGARAALLGQDFRIVAVVARQTDAMLLWTLPRLFHWADLTGATVYDQGAEEAPLELLLATYRDTIRSRPVVVPGTPAEARAAPPGFLWTAEPYASQLLARGFRRAALPGAEIGPYPALVLVARAPFARAHRLLLTALIAGLTLNAEALARDPVGPLDQALRPYFPTVSRGALQSSLLFMRRFGLFATDPLPEPLFARMAAVDPEGPWRQGLAIVDERLAEEGWRFTGDLPAP